MGTQLFLGSSVSLFYYNKLPKKKKSDLRHICAEPSFGGSFCVF